MKRCATCNKTYTDDLMFCLSDGTPLIGLRDDFEQPTAIRPSPVGGSSSVFKYLAAALASLLVLVVIAAAALAWILWSRNGSTANAPANTSVVTAPNTGSDNPNANRTQLKEQEEELERERRRLADERKKLDDDKRLQTEPQRFTDPRTARISFRRGAVGETVSGKVSRSRSYVLRTLAGQYLSASVRSDGACVVFDSGSTTTEFTTGRGDTYLTLQNNCDNPTSFTISLSVR